MHYQILSLGPDGGGTVRALFREPGADPELNWLFLSTSGVHGTYTTLDDIEADAARPLYEGPADDCPPEALGRYRWRVDADGRFEITVLIVHPRTVTLKYGECEFDLADIPWLRAAVERTVRGVVASQVGNRARDDE